MPTRPSWNFHSRPFSKRNLRSRASPDSPLHQLEERYRTALSGAVVAKASYLAQVDQPHVSPVSVERARWKWERIDARRHMLAVQLSTLRDGA